LPKPQLGTIRVDVPIEQKWPSGQLSHVTVPVCHAYVPATQGKHADAPVALLNEPAGQGVGFTEDSGQNEPMGQMTGAPDEQKWPIGQGTHVSWRMRWFE
jgi:hypothetical protein